MKNITDHTYYSSVTSKGQTTIPMQIRKQMNISSGDKVEFFSDGKVITIIPIHKSILDLQNLLPKPRISLTCEEMDTVIKGNR